MVLPQAWSKVRVAGETVFTLGAGGTVELTGGAQVSITIHIHTLTWANEITWSIDEGQQFGVSPQFEDNADYYEQVALSAGPHRLNYFDWYGDGWHGAYCEILPGTVTSRLSSAGSTQLLEARPVGR
eukprot:COSAG06_NODE_7696_length_2407_cov_16.363128_3_plen_127_part_00